MPVSTEEPTTSEQTSPAFYVGALITSAIGAVLLLATDFGWWYDYNYYAGYEEWGYVTLVSEKAPWSVLVLGHLALGLLFCAYVAFRGMRDPAAISQTLSRALFGVALYVTVFIVVAGIIFAAMVSDNTDWGFDAAFYGGLLGGGLTAVLAWIASRQSKR
jgi:hypothetical protein